MDISYKNTNNLEVTKLRPNGTITLPASIRFGMGVTEGDYFFIDINASDGAMLVNLNAEVSRTKGVLEIVSESLAEKLLQKRNLEIIQYRRLFEGSTSCSYRFTNIACIPTKQGKRSSNSRRKSHTSRRSNVTNKLVRSTISHSSSRVLA